MSGKLVGEVGAAREAGVLPDLSQGELLALVAIAEKCHTATRQGSVRMAYIQAWVGKSKRTTERAVQRLRELGLVVVVRRGSNSQGTRPLAPIYELVLPPPKTAEVDEGTSATQDGESDGEVLPPFSEVLPPFSASTSAKSESTSAIQDGDLDGVTYDGLTYDGSIDVGRTSSASATEVGYVTDARARLDTPSPVPGSDDEFFEKLDRAKNRIVNKLQRVGVADNLTLKDSCSTIKTFYVAARRQLVYEGVLIEFSENGPGSRCLYRLAAS